MITIRVEECEGLIVGLESEGHAHSRGDASGEYRIACAAVSSGLRAFAELLGSRPDVHAVGEAPSPGVFSVRVRAVDSTQWYRGACDLLRTELRLVERDYPDQLTLHVIETGECAQVADC